MCENAKEMHQGSLSRKKKLEKIAARHFPLLTHHAHGSTGVDPAVLLMKCPVCSKLTQASHKDPAIKIAHKRDSSQKLMLTARPMSPKMNHDGKFVSL